MKNFNRLLKCTALAAAVIILFLLAGCEKNTIIQETTPVTSGSVSESSVPAPENEKQSAVEASQDPAAEIPGDAESNTSPDKQTLSASGIRLDDFFSYSGKYAEDGSDAQVENIAAVTVTNTGEKAWQLIEFEVLAENTAYCFTATSFLPGMTITVLESGKKKFPSGKTADTVNIIRSGEYNGECSKNENLFKTDIYDGVINLTNISGRDFSNDIYVYYKNRDAKGYSGGITYRVNMGPLIKDGISQRPSSHLLKDFSEILYITYGE